MTAGDDLEQLLSGQEKFVQRALRELHDLLAGKGCGSYIKTIYVGYELDGKMVAAAYPRGVWAEVALALPIDSDESQLVDATHLTWPTLPVALEVREDSDVKVCLALAAEARDRVARGEHDVARPAEFFQGRVSRRGDDR